MQFIKNSLLALTTLFFISCGDNTQNTLLDIKEITINETEVNIYSTDRETSGLLTATAIFEDDTTEDVTEFVTWSSSNSDVAYVVNGTIYAGIDNGGESNITIVYKNISSSPIPLYSKSLIDYNISILDSNTTDSTGVYNLQAIGTFEDNITKTIQTNIVWENNNSSIITTQDDISSIEIVATGETNITSTLFEDINMSKTLIYIVD
ncbi:MAG: hypothetical protein U9P38_03565 [Campylobacterota bacterium]|nr:hypothetical protein [Campylobacterota bacterium]